MKKLAIGVIGFLLAGGIVSAQAPTRLYTQPQLPNPEKLDRLNLKLAWRTYLPTEGRRDGIFSVQIPERLQPPGELLLVQTRSATVLAVDSTTGTVLWRTRVGTPYAMRQQLGYNSKQIFVANGVELYALSRETGETQWVLTMPHVASSPPTADDEYLYIALGTGRLYCYRLPKPGEAAPVPQPVEAKEKTEPVAPAPPLPSYRLSTSALGVSGQSVGAVSAVSSMGQTVRSIGPLSSTLDSRTAGISSGPQPQLAWDYVGESRLELAPLVTSEFLLVANYAGTFVAMRKLDSAIQYRFQATAALSAPLGQHNDTAYVGSEDFSVSALDIFAGRILWRFLGAGPIRQKPEVTDDSVYIAPERSGLYRLDRESGQTIWRNPAAERFLAANPKFVYATDASGRLHVLDRARGTQLAVYDAARDFVVPVINDMTDRLFLASNDGLLTCLHDRDYSTPVRMKTVTELQSTAVGAAPKKPTADAVDMKKPDTESRRQGDKEKE
jgi:outer membrane protein assembly factor BamB